MDNASPQSASSNSFARRELKVWSIYLLTIISAIFVHEIGHCIPAWINGVTAIPTPAKEYILDDVSSSLQQKISLCGLLATFLFSIGIMILYLVNISKYESAMLAGALVNPGIYSLRFILVGRGHDGTEFQEAQAALGLNYSGNSIDWFLFALFIVGIMIWIYKSRPPFKALSRLFIGLIIALIFVIALQVANNAIFDPIFQS